MDTATSTAAHRRPTTDFATTPTTTSHSAKVHDINYILGPSVDKPTTTPKESAAPPPPPPPPPPAVAPATRPEDSSTTNSLLTSFSNAPRSGDAEELPIQYTPTTHRISKAKKGKKVHVCEFGCGKVFTRAEHRKRHEANHRAEPLYKCHIEGCHKPFQRLDLLNRHLERQHAIGPANAETAAYAAAPSTQGNSMLPPPKRTHSSTASGKNDWNTHRATIERLYITENKPLKDIKVHMEEHYGFTPVEDRAYEKAFRRLGLSKNIPSSTMEAILAAIEQRKQGGKDTTVYWRNQRVDEKRIHRFRQRLARETKVDPNEFLAHPQPRTFDLPEHVRCETPNNSTEALNTPLDNHSPNSSGDGSGDSSSSDDGNEERPAKRFACISCGEKFFSSADQSRHEATCAPRTQRHDCPAPGCIHVRAQGFMTREALWEHMVEHHQFGHKYQKPEKNFTSR